METKKIIRSDPFDLTGKIALITGGSSGLGLQMAEGLGERGAHVILISRKSENLAAAAEKLASQDIRADWIAADCAHEDDIARMVSEAHDRHGGIDILINNAGATWGAPAEDYPLAAWDRVMNVNVRAMFLLSQAVAKGSMIPRHHGRIINIASIAGMRGPNISQGSVPTIAYNTSKGAVMNFTRALAGEWGRHGITVNAIAPGFFPSKMTRGVLEKQGDAIAARAPLQRIGDDQDLKGATLLFASDAGKHITGQILAVDGGISAI